MKEFGKYFFNSPSTIIIVLYFRVYFQLLGRFIKHLRQRSSRSMTIVRQNTQFTLDCIFVIPPVQFSSRCLFGNMMKHCLSRLMFLSMLVISILFLNLYQYLSSHHHHQMRLRKPRGRRPNQEGTKWKLTKASDGAPDKLLLRPSLMFFCCCCFFSLFTYQITTCTSITIQYIIYKLLQPSLMFD